jgi:hypothetical protein
VDFAVRLVRKTAKSMQTTIATTHVTSKYSRAGAATARDLRVRDGRSSAQSEPILQHGHLRARLPARLAAGAFGTN